MPAYFSISVQFERKELYPSFVKDLYSVLENAGLKFKSGYKWCEKENLNEITEWNRKLLEQNFRLGFTEHYTHDYKQVLFDHGDYSEIRGFFLNNYPQDNLFVFEIIVPESDIMEAEGSGVFIKEKIEEWTGIAKEIWTFEPVRAIQMGPEDSDAILSFCR